MPNSAKTWLIYQLLDGNLGYKTPFLLQGSLEFFNIPQLGHMSMRWPMPSHKCLICEESTEELVRCFGPRNLYQCVLCVCISLCCWNVCISWLTLKKGHNVTFQHILPLLHIDSLSVHLPSDVNWCLPKPLCWSVVVGDTRKLEEHAAAEFCLCTWEIWKVLCSCADNV